MQYSFEEFSEKQRRAEFTSFDNSVAKIVLVESANQFSLVELCTTKYSLKYFPKPYRPSDRQENQSDRNPMVVELKMIKADNFCSSI